MTLKVAVIGANGQLGSDLVNVLKESNFEVFPLTHQDIEISEISSVKSSLGDIRPDFVINTAAFHNVNLCESNPDMARLINAEGALNVARVSSELRAKTVFVSTDYVFSGDLPADSFNKTTDKPAPINIYGKTKLAGEQQVLEIDPDNLVFRISSVFGIAGSSGKGGNFIEAILSKVSKGEIAEVVDDSLMSPTYSRNASAVLSQLISIGASGVHHGSLVGKCSWFDLAFFAAKEIGKSGMISPIQGLKNQTVLRPHNSSLDTSGLKAFGLANLEWQEGVTLYLKEKGHLV